MIKKSKISGKILLINLFFLKKRLMEMVRMVNAGNLGVGQPIFILPEGTLRNTGRDAQSRNIAAAKLIS